MIALSFASAAEANSFYRIATNTISNRTKRQERRSRKFSPHKNEFAPEEYDSGVGLRNAAGAGAASAQTSQPFSLAGATGQGNGRDKKRAIRKLTKADISNPTNFKHIAHVGWDAQKGINMNTEDVDDIDAFLAKAGVSTQQISDRNTREFIYDFINRNNVLASVQSEKEQQHPPPVPSRNVSFRRARNCFGGKKHYRECRNRIIFRTKQRNVLHRHLRRVYHGRPPNCRRPRRVAECPQLGRRPFLIPSLP